MVRKDEDCLSGDKELSSRSAVLAYVSELAILTFDCGEYVVDDEPCVQVDALLNEFSLKNYMTRSLHR